jgi:hypothetical protein
MGTTPEQKLSFNSFYEMGMQKAQRLSKDEIEATIKAEAKSTNPEVLAFVQGMKEVAFA